MRTLPRAGKEEIQFHTGHVYNFVPTLLLRERQRKGRVGATAALPFLVHPTPTHEGKKKKLKISYVYAPFV